MNANLTKLIGSAAAVLVVGSSAFAQQQQTKACPPSPPSCCKYEQGYGMCGNEFPAAYNAPARIDVQCSWDFYLSGSFTYWQADQEGMDLAYAPAGGKVVTQDFEYKPGFKVALGMDFNYDNWVGYVEYTWFRSNVDTHATGTYTMTDFSSAASGSSISSKWRVNMDIVDAMMSRPFYQGKKLTILPFGGLRGAFIRQNLHVNADTTADHYQSRSWAVGPRGGLNAHWLLGMGFRFEGDLSGSLLYTQYTKVSNGTVSYTDYNTIRPMADMGVGLGWGSYFDKQNYHFDLLATYDFNVMWGQNMMRALADVIASGASFEPASLHLQGLTVTARFDF